VSLKAWSITDVLTLTGHSTMSRRLKILADPGILDSND